MDTNMFDLQKFLFEQEPGRLQLLNYSGRLPKKYKIGVYRNHSFELVEHTIVPYLEYAGIGAEFVYSDYDDSLSFYNLDVSVDLMILWLDFSRYKTQKIGAFLRERLDYLHTVYPKPVLIVPFEGEFASEYTNEFCYSLEAVRKSLGQKFTDPRLEPFSGTKMSAAACMQAAKALGLKYIPALLKPALKAVIVDLDNTLYEGVLGEDGAEKLLLTKGHARLQQKLKELSQQGFFVCAVSKNDARDVETLFQARADFPLKADCFTRVIASWNDKADSITEISSYLNIGLDSILFIDDNIGELFAVKHAIPEIHEILAEADAEITADVLENYPSLLRLHTVPEDSIRKSDLQANELRSRLKNSTKSEAEYIRSLAVRLTYSLDAPEQAERISQLANKTNQFIFNYKRYTVAEIESLIKSENSVVVSVSLSDKLSDSGIICICVGKQQNDVVEIEECLVSCRALGRGIDDIIVLGAIKATADHFQCPRVRVLFQKGERNLPAEKFVGQYLKECTEGGAEFRYQLPAGLVETQFHK
jgi:HAD-superfamily phosphatase, subfamily IIIC/FkbH-like domain